MTIIDGIYKRVNTQNLENFSKELDMPDSLITAMANPKNEITEKITTNPDGSITIVYETSMCDELNTTLTLKLGETKSMTKPFPFTVTMTKKNSNTYMFENDVGGVTKLTEVTFHNYGFSYKASIKDKDITMTEEFKRITPKETGFFVFTSEKNGFELVSKLMPKMDKTAWESSVDDRAFRLAKNNGVYTWETHFGMKKFETTFKLDEEYEYSEQVFGFSSSNVTTMPSPGVFTTVSKSKKDGAIIETMVVFSEDGAVMTQKFAGITATYYYRRMVDLQGTFKKVSSYGMEGYLDALGIKEPLKTQIIEAEETHSCDMFGKKIRKTKSNTVLMPAGEQTWAVDVENTVDIEGFGPVKFIYTEGKDSSLTVMKFGGKNIVLKEKVSGDFVVMEAIVDGMNSSRAVIILVRE